MPFLRFIFNLHVPRIGHPSCNPYRDSWKQMVKNRSWNGWQIFPGRLLSFLHAGRVFPSYVPNRWYLGRWWSTAVLATMVNIALLAVWADRTVTTHAQFIDQAAAHQPAPRIALVLGTAPNLGDGRPNAFIGSVCVQPRTFFTMIRLRVS